MKTFAERPYRQRIVWRIRLQWTLIIALLVFMVVVGETGGDSRIMTPLADSLSRIMYFGALIYLGVRIHRNKQLLQNKLLLKEQALREHDEQTRALHLRSGGPVMNVMLFLLYTATMTASLYNMDMFHMALGLLIAAVALKIGAWWLLELRGMA